MRIVQTAAAALFSLAVLLMAGASEAGEITVMSTVAVREPYVELVPAFERATENKVTTMWVDLTTLDPLVLGADPDPHRRNLILRCPFECGNEFDIGFSHSYG